MHLDLRGLECPEPTIKTINVLRGLTERQEIIVVVDDAVCAADIPFQAGRNGYTARTKETGASEWTITLTPIAKSLPKQLDHRGG